MKGKRIALFLLAVILAVSVAGGAVSALAQEQGSTMEEQARALMSRKRVGVLTGVFLDAMVKEMVPDCRVEYFNSNTDLAVALDNGKIDYYLTDEPIARLMTQAYPDQTVALSMGETGYGYLFMKNNEKSDRLRMQMDEFLDRIEADGTLSQIDAVWFGSDESRQTVNYEGLSGENGTLHFATSADTGAPFVYYKDGQLVGYDLDIVVRFCREYGYGLQVADGNFSGLITAVNTGKCDFGGSCVTITEERKEAVNFSRPNYVGGIVAVGRDRQGAYMLSDKRVGVLSGSFMDTMVREMAPSCQVEYFNSNADLAVALDNGEIDYYLADEPIARMLVKEHPDQAVALQLGETGYGYLFMKNNEKSDRLREQMDEFLDRIEKNGTLDRIDSIWFGNETARQTVDYEDLTGENGTLRFVTSADVGAPFVYYRDGQLVGYDLDIAVRFCRAYGYALEIEEGSFSGIIAAVRTGKCDFGAACATITEERKKAVNFSRPNYVGGVVAVGKAQKQSADVESEAAKLLSKKQVGVVTGSYFDDMVQKIAPDCRVEYFNNNVDLAAAVDSGRIDYYIVDEPIIRILMQTYPDQGAVMQLGSTEYGYLFRKENEKSDQLRMQMDAFLDWIEADGTLSQIDAIWFGDDESLQTVSYSGLTGENGTLRYTGSSDTGAPFVYFKDGQLVGYDVDIAVRFCRAYGYDIEVEEGSFSSVMAAVSSGKADFGGSCVTITEERKEAVNFSRPNYVGGVVVAGKKEPVSEEISAAAGLLSEKRVAVLTGATSGELVQRAAPDCQLVYFDSSADMALALETDKVDGYVVDEPVSLLLTQEHPNQKIVATLQTSDYALLFPKDSEPHQQLRQQVNDFLEKILENGELDALQTIWFSPENDQQKVDMDHFSGENGEIVMGVTSIIGAPFAYYRDGQLVGYDIDIMARFCRENGYRLRVVDYDPTGLLSAVATGKVDVAGSGICVTQERGESAIFSDAIYRGGMVLTMKDEAAAADGSFLTAIGENFEKTFLREGRWQMFLQGIGVTLLITLLSAAGGTLLGFGLYLVFRRGKQVPNTIINVFIRIQHQTPTVVLLMILYYVIFGNVSINGIWVSVIGFILIFSAEVVGLLQMGVGAVNKGQTEAALALGYTPQWAFMRVILPQAARHFLPGYRSGLVALIKETAIVGYIAVQDLTKVGDIVRSRTYEPFFPLIVTAIIYFLLACLLIWLVRRVEFRTEPHNKKKSALLQGVKLK